MVEVSEIISLVLNQGGIFGIIIALFVAVALGVVVLSIIRGMLNWALTILLVMSLLLTAEVFYAYTLTSEANVQQGYADLIREGDEKMLLEKMAPPLVEEIDKQIDSIELTKEIKQSIIDGIVESDEEAIRLAAGQIVVNEAYKKVQTEVEKNGIELPSLSPEAIKRITVEITKEGATTADARDALVVEINDILDKEGNAAAIPTVTQIFVDNLPESFMEPLMSMVNSFDPNVILGETNKIKGFIVETRQSALSDFSKTYREKNIGRGAISKDDPLGAIKGLFNLALPLSSSPITLPFMLKEEVTAESIHNSMKNILLILVVVNLALCAGFFVINLGFAGLWTNLGFSMIVAGIMLFIFMKLGLKLTLLLDVNGPLVSKITANLEGAKQMAVEFLRIFLGRIQEMAVFAFNKRKTGGIVYIVLGAVFYAQGKVKLVSRLIPGGGKKKKAEPKPEPKKEEAAEEE